MGRKNPGADAINPDELLAYALEARSRAYAPYSGFNVGAALMGKSGRVYTACNVENVSYGLSICAERNAVFQAIANGEREFLGLAVVSASGAPPCGACRQVLSEFVPRAEGERFKVIVGDTNGHYRIFSLVELLPNSFDAGHIDPDV